MGRVSTLRGIVDGVLLIAGGGAQIPEHVPVAVEDFLAADARAGVVVFALSGEAVIMPPLLVL